CYCCGSEGSARSRKGLALYVYEYLLHVGAQKSAQTFLSEVCLIYFLLISYISE
uniref:Uncharacterized protein n=1 Tax=Ursus americanus TaxID=9643 RepID=A0A452QY25_URSAM